MTFKIGDEVCVKAFPLRKLVISNFDDDIATVFWFDEQSRPQMFCFGYKLLAMWQLPRLDGVTREDK